MMFADTTLPAIENSAANSSALVLNDRFPTKTLVCMMGNEGKFNELGLKKKRIW
jgi:hypothetical protein